MGVEGRWGDEVVGWEGNKRLEGRTDWKRDRVKKNKKSGGTEGGSVRCAECQFRGRL